jgi:hypothetical protein
MQGILNRMTKGWSLPQRTLFLSSLTVHLAMKKEARLSDLPLGLFFTAPW